MAIPTRSLFLTRSPRSSRSFEGLAGRMRNLVSFAGMESEPKEPAFRVHGAVVRGHGVASGRSGDRRFPGGTIAMQIPHFRALGLDLAGFFPGTINVDVSPWSFRPGPAARRFERVAWHPTMPAETFSFARVTLVRHGVRHAALVYWPHPETKPEHFQPAGVVEILAPRIDGIEPGDAVAIESDPDQALWDWRGDRAASVAVPSGS